MKSSDAVLLNGFVTIESHKNKKKKESATQWLFIFYSVNMGEAYLLLEYHQQIKEEIFKQFALSAVLSETFSGFSLQITTSSLGALHLFVCVCTHPLLPLYTHTYGDISPIFPGQAWIQFVDDYKVNYSDLPSPFAYENYKT